MPIEKKRIQFRRGTSSALTAENEILLAGELGIETDTGKYKIGDGKTNWINLAYAGLQLPKDENNNVYVLRGGQYVPVEAIDMTSEWSPTIDNTDEILLAFDTNMTPYQLTGLNV